MRLLSVIALALALVVGCIGKSEAAGQYRLILTSSSAQSCTLVSSTAQNVLAIVNTNGSAQSATLSIYDDAGSCTSADQVFSVVLGASQVVTFPITVPPINMFQTGFSYKLSAAAANNIVIYYFAPF